MLPPGMPLFMGQAGRPSAPRTCVIRGASHGLLEGRRYGRSENEARNDTRHQYAHGDQAGEQQESAEAGKEGRYGGWQPRGAVVEAVCGVSHPGTGFVRVPMYHQRFSPNE